MSLSLSTPKKDFVGCTRQATPSKLFRQLLLTTIIVNNVYEKLPHRIGIMLPHSPPPPSATLAIVWHIFWFCLVDCLISSLPVTGSNCSASPWVFALGFCFVFVVCSVLLVGQLPWMANILHLLRDRSRNSSTRNQRRSWLKFNDIFVFMSCFMHKFQSG